MTKSLQNSYSNIYLYWNHVLLREDFPASDITHITKPVKPWLESLLEVESGFIEGLSYLLVSFTINDNRDQCK